MKVLMTILLALALASLACSLDFNPPPIALTPQQVKATRTPFLVQPTTTSTSLPPSATPLPVSTGINPPPTAIAISPKLSVEQLRNATLTFPGSDQVLRTITLKNGKYSLGTDPAQAGYVDISIGDQIAFGDLNGDGAADAAIILAENYGGSGVFVSLLAILNQGGQPKAVTSAFIDDRPIINTLSIENGEISLDAIVHFINDPGCCPSMATTRRYRLIENALVLANLTTRINGGIERVITFESPANDSEVNGPFVIKGAVTIAPFENNLVYSVLKQGDSQPFAQAGFLLKTGSMGSPGTFELPLDFSNSMVKGPIIIHISDLSPADGSPLAVTTVFLLVK